MLQSSPQKNKKENNAAELIFQLNTIPIPRKNIDYKLLDFRRNKIKHTFEIT